MQDAGILLDPRASLAALARYEQEIRYGFLRVRPSSWEVPDPREFIERAARILETNLSIAGFVEAASELGVRTVGEAFRQARRLIELATAIVGLDPVLVMRRNADLLGPSPTSQPDAEAATFEGTLEPTARVIGSLVASFDIEALALHAQQLALEVLGHRARKTFEALEAFVCRNSPGSDRRARLLGLAYAQGRLGLDEVAELMGRSRSDAIAYLEKHGFCRAPAAIELDDRQRAEILRGLREDRLARAGKPQVDERLVVRDVIASQRIEGIDARPWLPPPT